MTEGKSGERVEQVGKKPGFLTQLGKEEWLREEMNRPGMPRECRPMVSAGVLKTRGLTRPAGVERGKRVGPGVGHSAPSQGDRLRPRKPLGKAGVRPRGAGLGQLRGGIGRERELSTWLHSGHGH